MATKEKVIELKAKADKITKEELQSLHSAVNDNNAIQFRIGSVEAQKYNLLKEHGKVQEIIISLQNQFKEKYGTYDINLQDGTINYEEDGE